jgi:DNA-binding helix-hairpin-helix protein with protein kinase domain
MLKVSGHEPLHEIYSPGARKSCFPGADYKFLIRTAANISRAVATVHATGCVIGDINHSGILVSENATVALIDADSFQIKNEQNQYLCRVGVPEYTPPELQGKKLDGIVRTPNHDAFGLAVVVFQLLCMGRHPFSGRPDQGEMPLERAIAEGRFAYSQLRKVGMSPPPGVPGLADFPPPIRAAFEQAFQPATQRPSAEQWVALLSELETNLRACGKSDLHHYPASALECPWCRMENKLGTLLFSPKIKSRVTAESATTDLASLWRAIESVQPPSLPTTPNLRTIKAEPTPDALDARRIQNVRMGVGGFLVFIAILIFACRQEFQLIALGTGITGIYFILTHHKNIKYILNNAVDAEQQWMSSLKLWETRINTTDFEIAKNELLSVKNELVATSALVEKRISEYQKNRREEHLRYYLQNFRIRKYKIRGIGPGRIAMLTSYGVETANDVTLRNVLRIPGFGPENSKPLFSWRNRIESRFVFNSNQTPIDQNRVNTIRSEARSREIQLLTRLRNGPSQLKQLSEQIRVRSTTDPTLQRLHENRLQAQADLRALRKKLPPMSTPALGGPLSSASPVSAQNAGTRPSPPHQPSTPRPSTPTSGTVCPTCGSSMIVRIARRGGRRGNRFWGCTRYPACKGTRPM